MRAHEPVRIVQIGLGLAGRLLHLPALGRISGVEVVAACDPDPAARAAVPSLAALGDPAEALAVPCDAVVIATPPETHEALAEAAISMGRDVYLEKPMATSSDAALRLAERASAHGVVLQLGFAYRYHPLWVRVRDALARGSVSRPIVATACFTASRDGVGWSAPVVDVASHHVDLLSWMLGASPLEVEASAPRLSVRWPDGSELQGTYDVGPPVDRVVLAGRQGSITVDRLHATRLRGRGPRLGLARLPHAGLVRAHAGRQGWERSFEYALRAFVRTVRERGDARPGPADGLRAVAVGEATLHSLETGAVVRLGG